jgi:hypothetical protein
VYSYGGGVVDYVELLYSTPPSGIISSEVSHRINPPPVHVKGKRKSGYESTGGRGEIPRSSRGI